MKSKSFAAFVGAVLFGAGAFLFLALRGPGLPEARPDLSPGAAAGATTSAEAPRPPQPAPFHATAAAVPAPETGTSAGLPAPDEIPEDLRSFAILEAAALSPSEYLAAFDIAVNRRVHQVRWAVDPTHGILELEGWSGTSVTLSVPRDWPREKVETIARAHDLRVDYHRHGFAALYFPFRGLAHPERVARAINREFGAMGVRASLDRLSRAAMNPDPGEWGWDVGDGGELGLNDPYLFRQWVFHWNHHGIVSALAGGAVAEGVVVAVLDSGIDLDHPDLRNVLWVNPRETPNGRDDSGSGHVDDIHGASMAPSPHGLRDVHGHGTIVSGPFAESGNAEGVAGIAPGARVMVIKGTDTRFMMISDAVKGIHYAMENGAHILNHSYGDEVPMGEVDHIWEAVALAAEHGLVVTGPGGNEDIDFNAAGYRQIRYSSRRDLRNNLCLLADGTRLGLSRGGRELSPVPPPALARGSNYGVQAGDMAVAGHSLFVPVIGEERYASWNGTSLAAPMAAGMLALLKNRYPDDRPEELLSRFVRGADQAGDLAGMSPGRRRANIHRALAVTDTRPPNSFIEEAYEVLPLELEAVKRLYFGHRGPGRAGEAWMVFRPQHWNNLVSLRVPDVLTGQSSEHFRLEAKPALGWELYRRPAGTAAAPLLVRGQASGQLDFVMEEGYDFLVRALPAAGEPDGVWVEVESHDIPPKAKNPLFGISTRGQVRHGANVMIAGFWVDGTAPKQVLVTGRSLSLEDFGLAPPTLLQNPRLRIFNSAGEVIHANTGWKTAANWEALDRETNMRPSRELESALLVVLPPGSYTAHLDGIAQGHGLGIVEVFDMDALHGVARDSRLRGISTRGRVESGAGVMIAGVVVESPGRYIVLGKSHFMSQFFPAGTVLEDPELVLFDAAGQEIDRVVSWLDRPEAAAIDEWTSGGLDPREAAMIVDLQAGPHTVHLRDTQRRHGIALVEVYALEVD